MRNEAMQTVAESTHLDNLLDELFGLSAQTTARQAWREAVSAVSARAKAQLPEANGRVEKAEQLVLHGDVEIMADGKARVAWPRSGDQPLGLLEPPRKMSDSSS
jgi:hypothetical protein